MDQPLIIPARGPAAARLLGLRINRDDDPPRVEFLVRDGDPLPLTWEMVRGLRDYLNLVLEQHAPRP
jgi:hypothetical protein